MNPHLRTVTVAGLAALSLGLAPGQPAASDALGESQLRAALLDPVDFPEGWASDSEEAAAERGFGVPRPSENGCRELFDSGADGSQRAGFAKSATGPFVTTVVTAHDSEGAAGTALSAFRATAAECGTFHAEEGPAEGAVTVAYDEEPRDDPEALGDECGAQRYNRRLDGETAGTPVIVEVVIARVGAHTIRVAQAGREGPDTGSVTRIAERAIDKLTEVIEGNTPQPRTDQPGTTRL
ncbi:hypothetical protein [Streptomyces sp. NBRC 109706]|uniref:hypothetical protein n=1 Tax=Streptomyces sp. NBRC 109706 TaxID=1550035 RepID=UPI0007833C94|nr:hypothetical protein [Streptomyces sp. NBRC 109706]